MAGRKTILFARIGVEANRVRPRLEDFADHKSWEK
jgi:hypothetical protein